MASASNSSFLNGSVWTHVYLFQLLIFWDWRDSMTGQSRALALSESPRSVPSCLQVHLHGFDTLLASNETCAYMAHIQTTRKYMHKFNHEYDFK